MEYIYVVIYCSRERTKITKPFHCRDTYYKYELRVFLYFDEL